MSLKLSASLTLAALTALGLAAARPAQAQTAITFTGLSGPTSYGDTYEGLIFTPTSDLLVTSLGFANTAVAPETVQLYSYTTSPTTTSTQIIGPTTVTTDASFSGFTFTPVTPTLLTKGTSYVLFDNYGSTFASGTSGFTADPAIGFQSFTYANTYSGQGPNGVPIYQGTGALGHVNFQYETIAASPEPSQFGVLALVGLGLGGLMLKARKRQSAASAA